MNEQISSSLVALALLAARSNNMADAAQLLVHASNLPGTDALIEELLQRNAAAEVLTQSVLCSESSSAQNLFGAINDLEECLTSVSSDVDGLYAGDEFVSVSMPEDDDEEDDEGNKGVDLDVLDDDEDDDNEAESTSASGIKLVF